MHAEEIFNNQCFTDLARSYESDAWWPEMQRIKAFSMLHFETLYLLRHFAAKAKGGVVEIGAYRGGGTLALARGVQNGSGAPVITFEVGGAYTSHPQVGTDDILRDLHDHLKQFGAADVVNVIGTRTIDPAGVAQMDEHLNGRAIDMAFFDADGDVGRDFDVIRDRLSDGAIIAVDDYVTTDAPDKRTLVTTWVDEAKKSGLCQDYGLYRWGTWFGRYHRP